MPTFFGIVFLLILLFGCSTGSNCPLDNNTWICDLGYTSFVITPNSYTSGLPDNRIQRSLTCTDSLITIEDSINIHYKFINYKGATCLVLENGFAYFPEDPVFIKDAGTLPDPVLKIAGLAVGDSINRDNFIFTTTQRTGLFEEIVVEIAKYVRNPAVTVQILPNNIIYHIEKEIASAYQFESLIEDITSILQVDPVFFSKDYEYFSASSYTWEHNGCTYSLRTIHQKTDMYLSSPDSYTFSMQNDILQQIISHHSK